MSLPSWFCTASSTVRNTTSQLRPRPLHPSTQHTTSVRCLLPHPAEYSVAWSWSCRSARRCSFIRPTASSTSSSQRGSQCWTNKGINLVPVETVSSVQFLITLHAILLLIYCCSSFVGLSFSEVNSRELCFPDTKLSLHCWKCYWFPFHFCYDVHFKQFYITSD